MHENVPMIKCLFWDKWHNGHCSIRSLSRDNVWKPSLSRDKMYCVFCWRIHVFVSALQYWGLGWCRLQRAAGAASAQLPAVTTLTQTVAIRPAGVCRVCVQPSTLYSCTLHWHSSEQHRTLLNSHCFVALIVTLFCKAKCYLTNFCDIWLMDIKIMNLGSFGNPWSLFMVLTIFSF